MTENKLYILSEMGISEQSPKEEMEWIQRAIRHLSNREYTLSDELLEYLYERRSELNDANDCVVQYSKPGAS